MARGKKTIASKILLELKDEGDEVGNFLVLYDFKENPSKYFYRNLNRIYEALEDGERILVSTIECKRLKTARAVKNLAKRYKADVLLYSAELRE